MDVRELTWLEAQQKYIREQKVRHLDRRSHLAPITGCTVHTEPCNSDDFDDQGDLDIIGGWWIDLRPNYNQHGNIVSKAMHMWPDKQPAYRSD